MPRPEGVIVRTGIFHQTLQSWAGRPVCLTMEVRWGYGPLTVTGILRARSGPRTLREWWIEPLGPAGAGMFGTPLHLERMTRRHEIDPGTRQAALRFWNDDGLTFELALLRDIRYSALAERLAEPRFA